MFTPAGRAIGVQYDVVELHSLTPSHTDDFAPNPAYPHSEGVQPRDRSRDANVAQVQAIAGGLQPERLGRSSEAGTGAPIVGPDAVVESGNDRVLALRRVYSDPTLAAQRDGYRQWLDGQGFDTIGMAEPVLIARRTTPMHPEERVAFVQEANSPPTQTMSAVEQARADARLIDPIIPLHRGGDVRLDQNSEFVNAFMRGVSPSERGRMTTQDGGLSDEGAARIRAALVARAYGDEMGPLLDRMLEGGADRMKAIAGALRDVSAPWAAMRDAAARGDIAPDMDVTADLIGAIRMVLHARDKRMRVSDIAAQMDLEAPPLTTAGRAMLAVLHGGDPLLERAASRASLTKSLGGYVDEAIKSRPGTDMFGMPPPSGSETLTAVMRREERLSGVDPALGPQRTIAAVADSADTARARIANQEPDAAFLEAQRLAAARDFEIATVNGARSAVDVLEEAEKGVMEAQNAAACLLGLAA